mgnify:CR=1 FL=1|jgi:very-short-patch-repair endonuclease
MDICHSLLNKSERLVFDELKRIGVDNNFNIYPKIRLCDVIDKGKTYLSNRQFDFYTRSHCDFVIADSFHKPKMVVEYDGPYHKNQEQLERDEIKNDLCRRVGLGILRIDDRHVTRHFRGMTLLRWIVEVQELQRIFDENQAHGLIPFDEPFDPSMASSSISGSVDGANRFPYWLSADHTTSIQSFMRKLDPGPPKGWGGIFGNGNKEKAGHRLSWLYFNGTVLYTKTSIRIQDLDFPHYDLLSEIDLCELGLQLKAFQGGDVAATSPSEFRRVFLDFCEKFDAHPSYSSGRYPFHVHFDFDAGWDFSV